MPPATRISDMHVCPMVTPGVPPIPHVGGPVVLGCFTVLTGSLPQARATDMCVCVGPPDSIAMGSPTVLVGGLMAARMGDPTVHGGTIVAGLPTVLIGNSGSGGSAGGGPVAGAGSGKAKHETSYGQAAPFPKPKIQANVLKSAAQSGTPFCEICNR
jgi:uncharacterized Zn-binding protein involved in type VI secretion